MQTFTGTRACRILLAATLLPWAIADTGEAGGPLLDFDFPRTIQCTVAAEETADSSSRIVRCVLPLSVRLLEGDIRDVREIRVEIGDCDRRLRVRDFAPSTQLVSLATEDIEWSKTTETGKSFAASLGGEAPVLVGETIAHVTPTLNGGLNHREIVTQREKRAAPKQVVVASGTVAQGHGVFFTLRPTPQTSLEGMHQLSIDLEVPAGWRGDALYVVVEAAGEEKFLWITQTKRWAQEQTRVAIYLAGDVRAAAAAKKFVQQ